MRQKLLFWGGGMMILVVYPICTSIFVLNKIERRLNDQITKCDLASSNIPYDTAVAVLQEIKSTYNVEVSN